MTTGTGKSARPTRRPAGDQAAATDTSVWGIIAKEKAARLKKTAALRAQRLERSAREASEAAAAEPDMAQIRPPRKPGRGKGG